MTTFGLYGARLSLAVWRHFTCYIFFVFTYYFVLSLKNKYTILLLYYTTMSQSVVLGYFWVTTRLKIKSNTLMNILM